MERTTFKKLSREHKLKISQSLQGHKTSEETKRKIGLANSIRQVGNKNALGHICPQFLKEKLSALNQGYKHTVEARKKIGDAHRGEKSHFWIKDRKKLKQDERLKAYDSRYKLWMLQVKRRDGWKCKIVNPDCKGRLEAHHILNWIDYPELRYEVNNGITLCRAHHPRKRSEEAKLSPFFQSLVAEMK